MEEKITLRNWINNFKNEKYTTLDVKTQIEAGWYDWFCKDSSLRNKTYKMGNIIKQIKEGGKINLDSTYVWFKNNCPLAYPLYDDFRLADIQSKVTKLLVQINSPWHEKNYTVFCDKDFYKEPVFQTDSLKALIKWINKGWDE